MTSAELLVAYGLSTGEGEGLAALNLYRENTRVNVYAFGAADGAKRVSRVAAKPSAAAQIALFEELTLALDALQEVAVKTAPLVPDVSPLFVPIENARNAISWRRELLEKQRAPQKRGRPRGTVDVATRALLLRLHLLLRGMPDADIPVVAAALLKEAGLAGTGTRDDSWTSLVKKLRTADKRRGA